mmetsp:Transcript_65823/g.155484  ORF Transcript_65823/g.155484 Transcript_65823/m.155484 type:complete len:234 (+) Transcript_65823:3-704(+)
MLQPEEDCREELLPAAEEIEEAEGPPDETDDMFAKLQANPRAVLMPIFLILGLVVFAMAMGPFIFAELLVFHWYREETCAPPLVQYWILIMGLGALFALAATFLFAKTRFESQGAGLFALMAWGGHATWFLLGCVFVLGGTTPTECRMSQDVLYNFCWWICVIGLCGSIVAGSTGLCAMMVFRAYHSKPGEQPSVSPAVFGNQPAQIQHQHGKVRRCVKKCRLKAEAVVDRSP